MHTIELDSWVVQITLVFKQQSEIKVSWSCNFPLMWKHAQCLMWCISLDKNGRVNITAVPTTYSSSQCHCNCAGRDLDRKRCTLSRSRQVLGHLNDPVGTPRSWILATCLSLGLWSVQAQVFSSSIHRTHWGLLLDVPLVSTVLIH